jgi:plasmid stabilization system protein ParE
MKLVFKRSADDDLVEAASWYEEQRQNLGEVFLDRVWDKLLLLCEFPFMGPVVHGTIRRVTVAPYRYSFFYLIDEDRDRIVVMAVEHEARDPESVKARLEREEGGLG